MYPSPSWVVSYITVIRYFDLEIDVGTRVLTGLHFSLHLCVRVRAVCVERQRESMRLYYTR